MDKELIHILLIDDEEDSFFLTKSLLARATRARYELDWVSTYEAGLEAIHAGRHDAYLVDYRLGTRSGLDLVRQAVAQGWAGPFLMLTNQDDHDIDLESLQAGAADYIGKNWHEAAGIERALLHALERARRNAAERNLSLAQQEFEAARLIQKRMIPNRAPDCPGWDISGRCLSARATGGDFFDYVPLRHDRLNIVVADVSSHGLGAALVMAETRRLFRTMAKAECDLAEILTIVNQAIIEDTDVFVTLFTVQLDLRKRRFIYAALATMGICSPPPAKSCDSIARACH